jgi:hypothetical protein
MNTGKQSTPILLTTFIAVLLLLNSDRIFSQPNFEQVYYMGLQNIGHDITETSDHNFLFASGGYTGPDHSYFVKIDQAGAIIWKKDFAVSGLASGISAIETKDHKYAFLSEEQFSDPIAVVLRKAATSSAVNWVTKYPGSHTAPYFTYRSSNMEQAADSSFITIGYVQGSTNKCNAVSFSKTGAFNWYKEILPAIDMRGLQVKPTADSCYIALATYTNEVSSELIKLSSSGDVLWNKKLTNFIGNTLIVDGSNNFVIGGTGLASPGRATPVLLKYSSIGDSTSRVDYPNSTSRNMISNSMIMLHPNSFSIAVQSEKTTSNKYYAVVFNTDSLLNLYSTDTVTITKTNNCIEGVSVPNMTISAVSGGGYCLVGTIDSTAGYTPRTFVKVSSTFTAIQSPAISVDHTITVYPNPGSGIFQVSVDPSKNELFQFEVYDLKGQKLLRKELNGAVQITTIDCSGLPTGVYSYRILASGRILKTDKLVIIK